MLMYRSNKDEVHLARAIACILRKNCKDCAYKKDNCFLPNRDKFMNYLNKRTLLSADLRDMGEDIYVLNVSVLMPKDHIATIYDYIKEGYLDDC